MSYSLKLEQLKCEIENAIAHAVNVFGNENNETGFRCIDLSTNDFYLDNGNKVFYVGCSILFDADCLHYSFESIDIEELCRLVDYIS